MFDPHYWVDALKLPARIIGGLFLCAALLLIFDHFALIRLGDIHALARPIATIATVLCGSLLLAAICGMVYDAYAQRHKATLLSRRRDIRREEAKRDRAEYEAQILKRLAYLSEEELAFAANCLRKNEQSFLAYVFSPPVSNLRAKGLVGSPRWHSASRLLPVLFLRLCLGGAIGTQGRQKMMKINARLPERKGKLPCGGDTEQHTAQAYRNL